MSHFESSDELGAFLHHTGSYCFNSYFVLEYLTDVDARLVYV